MDDRRRRFQRRALMVLMVLFLIAMIGEAVRDDRYANYHLGVAIFGIACLIALAFAAVAIWGG